MTPYRISNIVLDLDGIIHYSWFGRRLEIQFRIREPLNITFREPETAEGEFLRLTSALNQRYIDSGDRIAQTVIDKLKPTLENIMAKVSALAGLLAGIETKLDESQTEIVALITQLRDQLGDVEIPADAQATLDRLEAKSKALADIVPDVAP